MSFVENAPGGLGADNFRKALETAADCVWEWDIEAGKIFFTGHSISAIGLDETRYTYEQLLELIHPHDKQELVNAFERVIEGDVESWRLEYRVLQSAGDYIWVAGSGVVAEKSDGGRAQKMVGSLVNISERKALEEKYINGEKRFRRIFDNAAVAIGVVKDRKIISVNQTLLLMIDYEKNELDGRDVRILYADDEEYFRVGEYKRRHLKKNQTTNIETVWVTKGGEPVNILLSSTLLDPEDAGGEVVSIAIDLTPDKESEKALSETELTIKRIFNQSADLIHGLDENGVIQYISPAAKKILGYDPEEMVGRDFGEFVNPEIVGMVGEIFAEFGASPPGASKVFQATVVSRNGEKRILEINSSSVWRDGKFTGVQGVARDITELERLKNNG